MGFGRDLLKSFKAKIVGKYGEKLVASIADTSSDAPNTRFNQPKRNKYDEMEKEGQLGEKKDDR